MNLNELPIGTRIYNGGDMANVPHFGTITAHDPGGRFPAQLQITPDAGAEREAYWITPASFSRKYSGHCGTRFVTEAAYKEFREKIMQSF